MAGDIMKQLMIEYGFKLDRIAQNQEAEARTRLEERATDKAEREADKRAKLATQEAREREKARQLALKKEREARDETLRSIQSVMVKAAKIATGTIATIEAAAVGLTFALDRAAKKAEASGFFAGRNNTTVAHAQAFGYAASQLGSSSEEANESLEKFGHALRFGQQGYGNALKRIGVNAKDAKGHLRDSADIATDLGDALERIAKTKGYAVAMANAGVFGFDERMARALMDKRFRGFEAQHAADQKAVGADPDAAARSGHAFEQSMRHLEEVLGAIGTKIEGDLYLKLKPLLDQLAAWFTANGGRVADIIARVAEDLAKLAAAIAEKLGRQDWDKIIGHVETFAVALGMLLGKLGGNGGLVVLLGLLVPRLKALFGLGMPPWLSAMLGLSIATDLGVPNEAKPGLMQKWDDERAGLPGSETSAGDQLGAARRGWNWLKSKFSGGGSPIQPGSDINGKLTDNQKEAYDTAIKEGLNPTAARALVANMTGEGLHVPHDVHWDGTHYGHGIVQWDDERSAAIKRQFGKMPEDMSVAEQTRAALWEIKNRGEYGATAEALKGNNAGAILDALVNNYEKPGNRARALGQRIEHYRRLGGLGENAVKTPPMVKVKPPIETPPMPKEAPAPTAATKASMIGPTVIQREVMAAAMRDVKVSSTATFHVDNGGQAAASRAHDLPAGRTSGDFLRNLQTAEA